MHEKPVCLVCFFCHFTLPLCSNYAVLMFDDIGPLTPNQLGPFRQEKKANVTHKIMTECLWLSQGFFQKRWIAVDYS